jgi:glycosyltransferase involved in cell wall biosynthesis
MSDSSPTVSVIIPSYNCEAYIAETIGGVLGQTLRDVELIVVDDGSTDRTCEIVAAYGARVRLLTQKNAGVCAARNFGIREARGQYICLMDHDDYWFPDKLELQLEQMLRHPEVGLVYSSFIWWHPGEDGNFPDHDSFDQASFPVGIDERFSGWIYHELLLDCWVLTSAALIRAEVFDKCGMYDESLPYSEDWDLWLRISREYPFIKLKRPLTLYRQHPRQGNRVPRSIDYRTELLTKAAAKWGLCSRDGRCVAKRQFNENIARYHSEYGLHNLSAGNLKTANQAFLKAWSRHPQNWKSLAFIPAALLGWRPKW